MSPLRHLLRPLPRRGPHHDLPLERFDPATHPGWDAEGSAVARSFGDEWHAGARTAVLMVPSVAGQPVEWNCLINPAHFDAARG